MSAKPKFSSKPVEANDGAKEGAENDASETNEASEKVELTLEDRRKDDLPCDVIDNVANCGSGDGA